MAQHPLFADMTTAEIVDEVIGKTYSRFGFVPGGDISDIITELVEDPKRAELDHEGDTSNAAEKVRQTLWGTWAGGGASAGATCELFIALGREEELGWVKGEAHFKEYDREDFLYKVEQARNAK